MGDVNRQLNTFLIVGLTPYFLDKPALWWKENEAEIIAKRKTNPLWLRNTILIEAGQKIGQSQFLRALADLGYEKTFSSFFPGTFKHLGSTIIIRPINKEGSYAIDFFGQTIETISPSLAEKEKTAIKTLPTPGFGWHDGDYLVHIDHGIGIFRGIIKEAGQEYFKLEYARPRPSAAPDTLLVPLEQKKKLEPYFGLEAPRISRLGTPLWERIKKKAKEDIIAYAKELISLYQNRIGQKRPPYLPDTAEKEIWDSFEHELTADQEKAMAEIFEDMTKDEPMDRLLAGDVGFGKTEIALRAALRAALNSKQVTVLSPTTVLADQHLVTFQNRLNPPAGGLPLEVRALTRLQSQKQNKEALKGLASGAIDIVIGTHRMFSKDVNFRRPGLLIIDEEQRFGVKHKEHFKKLYPAIDILSLSATPIPRTLSLSLSGIRKSSQIKEAPRGRLAPLTTLLPFSKKLVKEAILAEISRKGQVYYLSGRIRSIPKTTDFLYKLLPKTKIAAIHGRMKEKNIVETMKGFRKKEIDVLVSTTIIENGLDISSANTLIVENSALLGLAQAHQLRGRIGRGDIKAFAYFLYDPKRLTPEAEKRLENLMALQELGSGFEIAKRDLELRGAGNILGKEQTGVAFRIGWNLYFQFMNEAAESLAPF